MRGLLHFQRLSTPILFQSPVLVHVSMQGEALHHQAHKEAHPADADEDLPLHAEAARERLAYLRL